MKHALFAFAFFALAPAAAAAGCNLDEGQFEDLVGFEIEAVKTVAGWIDERAGEVGDKNDWEGCRYNREIIFEDGTTLTCKSYDYGSAWGTQQAVVFKRYSDVKVCIDDELMDVK